MADLMEDNAFANNAPQKEFKLTIELVPTTAWYLSLHQLYRRNGQASRWMKIKKELFEKEGQRCWICGAENSHLEAHEVWEYNAKTYIQKLAAIHHLCDMCHKIKHIGFWCHTPEGRNKLENSGLSRKHLVGHFCKVNNCSEKEFEEHEERAFRIFEEQSKREWKQDFGAYGHR